MGLTNALFLGVPRVKEIEGCLARAEGAREENLMFWGAVGSKKRTIILSFRKNKVLSKRPSHRPPHKHIRERLVLACVPFSKGYRIPRER